MAKDKDFEKRYNAERLRRIHIRKDKRKENRAEHRRIYGRGTAESCESCGGFMSWCSCCQQWSRTCCEEYGTCMCS